MRFFRWCCLFVSGMALMAGCLLLATGGLSSSVGAWCIGFGGCLAAFVAIRSRGAFLE